ncbi:thiolase family protein [Sphingomonas sp.]|uniref:thiolase family protein n=1 Tax=Sphingomonas sp. TaxID=28214 RepID=UPI003F705E94
MAVVIVSAVRTAVATARRGSLVDVPTEVLARHILSAAIDRSRLAPELIDDVIFAESLYGGGAVARHAAVEAGIVNAGGMALNRHCAGSLSAIAVAAGSIISGMDRAIVAGGVHSSSFMPMLAWRTPGSDDYSDTRFPPTHPNEPEAPNDDMTITVGWSAAQAAGLSREEQDEWALRSHQRAVAATDAGRLAEEIAPIRVQRRDGTEFDFAVDEHPRRDTSMERLGSLKVIHPEIDGFSITAGNSSGINDAAAALMVVDESVARAEGLEIMARVRGWCSVGVPPRDTGISVIRVVPKLLGRTGVAQSDIAIWEINEAFASVPLATCRALGIDEEIVNVSGSGCSIGHPIAASGARMVTSLIYELRRRGGGLGVAAMCAGGGQAGSLMIEV